ncbi:hypothetical protein A0H81_02065 [Grifola frondosa]|uniref:Uncharacterized protein n=1 Tax=Grifola frondosa TaxID=5627 RepID=A0A1C7MQR2_GRIFR|nr:hypothetical protein A0H81_02065 [Grifola frondosa]
MHLPRDEPLALNAVGSVVLHGLVKTKAGKEVDVQAVRCKPPPLFAVRHGAGALTRPDGIPPRVPDNLPEPKDYRLELSIGKKLSGGRCGRVFLTSTMSISDPSDPSDTILFCASGSS